MPSDSGETRRASKPHHQQTNDGGAPPPPPPEHEHLPCPRCESTNTKFCYYNNYNFSQPRHFCKSCRRYWTHGGTLRDIPVGGGSRKNAKRSRTCSSYSAVSSAAGNASSHDRLPAMPVFITAAGGGNGTAVHFGGDVKGGNVCGGGSFTSLLHSNGPGFLALGGGFGIGLGPGVDDVGFGLGKVGWPFSEVGSFGANSGGGGGSNGGGGGSNSVIENTWQLESGGEGGFVGGDCFTWPDLAISTPGNGLK